MRDYNPSAKIWPKPIQIPGGYCRRMIIIDVMNVLYSSTNSRLMGNTWKESNTFDAAGVLYMVYEFLRQGYEVLAVAKSHLRTDKHHQNGFIFEELEKMEILHFVQEDAADKSLDDRVLLHWATEYGAAVVSRDSFGDHDGKWSDAVKRRIGFSFKRDQLLPEEYHRSENRFKFTKLDLTIGMEPFKFDCAESNVALCGPDDPDYAKVFKIYRQISPTYFESRIRKCEFIADFLQLSRCRNHQSMGVQLPIFDYCPNTEIAPQNFDDYYQTFKYYYNDGKTHEFA